MANESGPDSRPISVAELLARSQGQSGDSTTTGRRSRDRGRRRVGREGAVSVSELTGEIPKVVDGSSSARTQPRSAPQSHAAPVTPSTGITPPAPSTHSAPTAPTSGAVPSNETQSAPHRAPQPAAPGPEPFPRSDNPLARRGTDDRAVSDSTPAHPGDNRSASGMPGYRGAPQVSPPMSTRDFSSDAVAQRLAGGPVQPNRAKEAADNDAAVDERAANAVTGIIPVVGGPDGDLTVVDSDDVVAYDLSGPSGTGTGTDTDTADGFNAKVRDDSNFGEVMDDFDAYRSFADVEDAPTPAKKKRRWFGRKKKVDAAVAGAAGGALGGDVTATAAMTVAGRAPSETETEPHVVTNTADREHTDKTTAVADTGAVDTGAVDTGAVDTGAVDTGGWGSPTGYASAADLATEAATEAEPDAEGETHTPQPAPPVAQAFDSPVPPVSDPEAATNLEETGDSTSADRETDEAPQAAGSPQTHESSPGFWDPPVADAPHTEPAVGHRTETMPTADLADADTAGRIEDGAHGPGNAVATEAAAEAAVPVDAAEKSVKERSPAVAWLLVIGQVLAGLAIGIGLFWGFTELWKWNPIFALILSVLVIFGIVTFAHVLRRTKDLATTLLASGVGLIVTIGPLVLLASR